MAQVLTGNSRYRLGRLGKLVLQVEVQIDVIDHSKPLGPTINRLVKRCIYRYATTEDIQDQSLLDGRSHIQNDGKAG